MLECRELCRGFCREFFRDNFSDLSCSFSAARGRETVHHLEVDHRHPRPRRDRHLHLPRTLGPRRRGLRHGQTRLQHRRHHGAGKLVVGPHGGALLQTLGNLLLLCHVSFSYNNCNSYRRRLHLSFPASSSLYLVYSSSAVNFYVLCATATSLVPNKRIILVAFFLHTVGVIVLECSWLGGLTTTDTDLRGHRSRSTKGKVSD